ncbi:COX15/CtaA family protein [Anaplasma bovis]|uniref:COX15/CtaA family protein n=1 Tax=Anaplasma bovis TaxID=186733 RepID=UPI002FEF6515
MYIYSIISTYCGDGKMCSGKPEKEPTVVSVWLAICCGLVLLMVLVGGITRLTGSGLSITEWKPVTGIVPPIGKKGWLKEKEKYEKTPEYQHINSGMSLGEFKRIYMVEYLHRLLGRLLGVVFLGPFLYFATRRKIRNALTVRMCVTLTLGLGQGVMGWLMVKSGLVDVPYVSHYRLAMHLFLTVLLFSILWYSCLVSAGIRNTYAVSACKYVVVVLVYCTTCGQMILGAMVAGLDAGLIFNTFPLMDGSLVPSEIFALPPLSGGFLNNGMVVQFLHRACATTLLILAIVTMVLCRRLSAVVLGTCIIGQFFIGVVTLLNSVPICCASVHQLGGFAVLAVELYMLTVMKVSKQ